MQVHIAEEHFFVQPTEIWRVLVDFRRQLNFSRQFLYTTSNNFLTTFDTLKLTILSGNSYKMLDLCLIMLPSWNFSADGIFRKQQPILGHDF